MGKRDKFLKKTKDRMEEVLRSRDVFLARLNKSIEELNDVLNLLGERLEDMYRLYAPELEALDREKYTKEVLSGKLDVKEEEKEDLKKCKELAERIAWLYELKNDYEKYEEKLCREICPNLSYVAGPHVAAKLIAHVGSLKRLALLPASTIQVIGAEKALFKHLRNKKIDPPKHGIIFQHPRISNSPKKIRGRLARTLASKLATAAKADAFTKNFISEKLKEEFDKRYHDLMEEYKRSKE